MTTVDAESDRATEQRRARAALLTACTLCPQAPSQRAHDDVATAAPVDVEERADKWLVLALSGTSALMTTLDSSIVNLALAAVAPASGSLADRLGSRWLLSLGLAIATLGLVLLSGLDQGSPIAYIVGCLVVTGLGQGIFQSPNSRALMGAAPPQQQGVASGILAPGRVIGQSLSVAVPGAVFATLGGAAAGRTLASSRLGLGAPQLAALQHTFVTAMRAALLVCAGLAAFGVLATLARSRESQLDGGNR